MTYLEIIGLIENTNSIEIEKIKTWLLNYQNQFYLSINKTNCRKWSKWVEDKTAHILPCCCPIREQDCIFIETYYKLQEIVEQYSKEDHFKAIVLGYKQIENNKIEVAKWFKKYQNIALELAFETEISIMLELKPYKNKIIQLNENEFKSIIEFQTIFNELEFNQIINQ